MVVQGRFQHYAFSPDICNRGHANLIVDEFHKSQDNWNRFGGVAGGISAGNNINCNVNGTTVFSSGPQESGLTCNASASRKRAREDPPMAMLPQSSNKLQCQSFAVFSSQSFHQPSLVSGAFPMDAAFSAPGKQLQSRLLESDGTSISGRPPAASQSPCSLMVSPLAQDLVSQLYQQNLEVDALVRLQSERLRSGLEEVRKRHCQALLSALDQQVAKRLKEKETDLENVSRRNAMLEEKVRQLSAENQIWFNCAKNSEAMVSSLRTSLEQVLHNVVDNGVPEVGAGDLTEGYGDSDGIAPSPAGDARSCCFEDPAPADGAGEREVSRQRWKACKVCGDGDMCALLLPCRHLCLCRDCESKVDACPICRNPWNASIQIFLS